MRKMALAVGDVTVFAPLQLLEAAMMSGRARTRDSISYLEPFIQLRCIDWGVEVTVGHTASDGNEPFGGPLAAQAKEESLRGLPFIAYEVFHFRLDRQC